MGRPLNSRYFGDGAGNQIKIRAKIGSSAEGNGEIIKQTGSTRYKVTVGSDTGIVYLVDKDNGDLEANEATITFQDSDANTKRVKKLLAHRAVFFDDTSSPWSFDPADGVYYQAADVDDGFEPLPATIAITAQPQDATVDAPDTATFTVTASATPDIGTLTYQWRQSQDGETYADISGATEDSYTTDDSTDLDGYHYLVVVSLTGATATPVTSDAATLTVNPVP